MKGRKAYSLVELSISILIISILFAGAATVSSKVSNKNRVTTTKEKIAKIYNAIGVYVMVNGALPCPSSIEIAKSNDIFSTYGVANCSTDNSGVYAASASRKIIYGMVPVKDLGLSSEYAEDDFGSKIAYIVDKDFTNSENFGKISSASSIIIKESLQDGSPSQIISDNIVMAIISYGPNKAGALPSNVSSLSSRNPMPGSGAELENSINGILSDGFGNFDNILVASDLSDGVFDDLVFYKTRDLLVSDFDLLHLIKCPNSETSGENLTITYGTNAPISFSWPESNYGQTVPASIACPLGHRGGVGSPTRKCGAFGKWEKNDKNDGVVSPCLLEVSTTTQPSDYCSVNIAGSKVSSVSKGSGKIFCNKENYDGSQISYTCRDTIFTPSGLCACKEGYAGSGCKNCATGYSDEDGNGCKKDCSISVHGLGISSVHHSLTQKSLPCLIGAGYVGSVAYTCDNGSWNKIGSCSCNSETHVAVGDGSCKLK